MASGKTGSQIMNKEQWEYYRKSSRSVIGLGECGMLPDGSVKIEGRIPVRPEELSEDERRKLRDAGIPA